MDYVSGWTWRERIELAVAFTFWSDKELDARLRRAAKPPPEPERPFSWKKCCPIYLAWGLENQKIGGKYGLAFNRKVNSRWKG